MISLDTRGDWSNTLNFFDKMLRQDYISAVEAQAQRGVEALMSATSKSNKVGNIAAFGKEVK